MNLKASLLLHTAAIILLCVALFTGQAQATAILTSCGFSTSCIYDEGSGLLWLQPVETAGMSFNDVSSNLSPGGSYAGFSYATPAQVINL